jgi:hypothetical protein
LPEITWVFTWVTSKKGREDEEGVVATLSLAPFQGRPEGGGLLGMKLQLIDSKYAKRAKILCPENYQRL